MKRSKKLMVFFDLLLAVLILVLSACQPEPTRAYDGARLRITNSGTLDLIGLVVMFPDEQIVFGDIPAGSTTEYMPVDKGVYNYAAYTYGYQSETVTQPVIDWVGETGKQQGDFTYVISFNPDEPTMLRITLVEMVEE